MHSTAGEFEELLLARVRFMEPLCKLVSVVSWCLKEVPGESCVRCWRFGELVCYTGLFIIPERGTLLMRYLRDRHHGFACLGGIS